MGDENKIYIGGLAGETTNDTLRFHFSQYGEVTDCVVMPDQATGRATAGFVIFRDMVAMNAALGTSNLVDGREVSCMKALRGVQVGAQPSQPFIGQAQVQAVASSASDPQGYNVVKIFVGGLPASCDHHKFVAYFERFGTVEDAVVMMDQQTQRSRGFGYVTFSHYSAVEYALQGYAGHQIDGKWIEVKKCVPRERMGGNQKGDKGKGKPLFGKGFGTNGKGSGGPPPRDLVVPPAVSPFVSFEALGPVSALQQAELQLTQQIHQLPAPQQLGEEEQRWRRSGSVPSPQGGTAGLQATVVAASLCQGGSSGYGAAHKQGYFGSRPSPY